MALHRIIKFAATMAAVLFPFAVSAGEHRKSHRVVHAHEHRAYEHRAHHDAYDDYNYFRSSYRHGSYRIVVANHHQRPGTSRSVFVDPVGYAYPQIKYRAAASGYRPLPEIKTTPQQRIGLEPPAARSAPRTVPTAPQ